jgi:hypothetical protein
MDPTYLLPDVGVFIDVRAKTRPRDGISKGHFMEVRRARSHHNPVDGAAFQILNNKILPRVGAHKHILPSNHHSRNLTCLLAYPLHIHMIGNVSAATANVNSYLPF